MRLKPLGTLRLGLRWAVTLGLVLGLGGCSSLSDIKKLSPWYSANDVERISVYVAPDPALQFAVSIDVVFVYTEAVNIMLSGMNASDWFSQKPAITAGYSNQMDLLEWQMVPGFTDEGRPLPDKHSDALAVMAFAYYPDNPDAKVLISTLKRPWLVFANGSLSATESPPVHTAAGGVKGG